MSAPPHSATSEKIDRCRLWLGLALAMSAAFGLLSLSFAFSKKYVVQDDARQYVFWMQRHLDPALFPNDLIADCFQTGAPPGMTALYGLTARAGVGPLLLSKLLPLALGLVATGFGFAFFCGSCRCRPARSSPRGCLIR